MDILFTLVIVAMLATLGVLVLGVFGMARGGEFNRRNSNRLMRMRIVLQGAAIALFVLFLILSQH